MRRLQAIAARAGELAADEAGQVTLEWALVMAAFALPMYFIFVVCLNVLVAHFQMISFLQTLPFP
jgi:hypothetical protein